MKTRSKYILLLFVGMIVLLLGGIFFTAQQEKEGPITADAAGSYWATPSVCPECGEYPSPSEGSLTFTRQSGCTYSYTHTFNRGGGKHSGTISIHTAQSHPKVEPTCTAKGHEMYVDCVYCHTLNMSYIEIPALGHDYGDWFVAQAATCTQNGTEQRQCSRCSARETRTIEATGHTWDSGTVTVSATCQRTGTRKYECTACGETKTETIAKRSHNYNICLSRIEPTCTASGRTAGYECQWCYANTCSTIPALGHDLEYYDGQPATCTEAGWNNYETCSRCEYTTYREIAATGHTPGAAATCTTPQTCTECGAILVEALGHKTVSHLGQDATCTEAGWKPYETCENCDYTTYEEIPALGHSFTSYVSNNDATCTEDGTETAKCDRCDVTDTRTDEGSALGHDWAEKWTTDGTSHWHECNRCDEINDKANHSGGEATCIALAKCEICGVEYGDFAEHVYVENAEEQYLVSAATCTAKATYYKSCSVCGEAGEEVFEYGEPLGHEYGEPEWTWEGYTSATATFTCTRGCGDKQTATASGISITNVVTTPAECEKEGLRTYTARVTFGGEEYTATTTETLAALGHDLEHHEAKPATCTEIGWEAYDTCSRCDYTTYVEIEALGHNWAEEWTTDGTSHWHECSRCDEINDKANHSGGEATCTNPAECEVCGAEYGEALGHTEGEAVRENEVSASCTAAGSYDEVVYCSVCGEELSRGEKVIEALGHDLEHHEAKPATCTEIGWNAYDTCTRCDYTTYVEIEALGHDWAEEWTTDGTSHWHECSRCDEINDKANHSGGEATCTNPAECEVCGVEYGEALGHTEGEAARENEVPASCTAAGSYDEVVYCSVCGEELSREEKVIDALGHSFTNYVSDNNATCTEDGTETAKCDRCEVTDTRMDEGSALGHDWAKEWTTDGTSHWHECSRCDEINDKANHSGGEATCTNPAECEVCGAEYGEALDHDFEHHEAKPATCTEIGWEAYDTCTRCDYTTYVEIAAKGHTFGPDATCTEDQVCLECGEVISAATGHIPGSDATCTENQTCSVCGEILTPALGHSFTSYISDNNATCTEDGTETAKCDRCEVTDTRTDEGSALGHDWAEEWTTDGTAHWHECSRCDEINDKASHSGGTATCTDPAECDVCGVAYGEALGHDLQHHDAQAATCTEIGWDAYDTCSRCDYTTYEEIPALGHTEGEAVRENEVAATCTVAGSYDEVVYCSVCGEELSREEKTIEALGHDWAEEWITDGTAHWHECSRCDEINDKASHSGGTATCTDPAECDVCGVAYGEALGHDLQHHDAQAATCTEIGWDAYDTCSRCDYTTYEEIPALGHTEGEAVRENEVDATCTVVGSYDEVVYCSVCGEELSREEKVIDALGHSFTNYVSDNNATCTEDGTETAKCDRCDVTDTRTDEGSALGHDWAEEWTTDGTAHWHECSRCDEINDKANHSGGTATCIELAECEVCGVEYGDFAEHNYVDGYCTVCGIIDGAALDNDKDDAKTDLDDVAQDAKDEIDASDLPDEVKEDLKDKVDEVINGAKDEVDGSTDFDDVDQAIEDAKDEIADAILDAEKDDAKSDLDEIAQNAKDEIDASDLPDDVKDDLKGKVDEIVTDAKGEIDGETSKEEVDQTVEDAQKEIEDAILNAEKDDAKSDLDEIAQSAKDEIDASDLPDDVKDELKNKVDEIVSNAKTEIDGETSKEEVDQTVEDAQKEIEDAILDAEKDDAKSDLDEIAQDAKDEIDASDLPDDVKDELKNKVDEIVSNAKGEIDGASSKEEIDTSFSEAETAIEEVNREALESAKEDVLSELEELAQSVKEEIDGSNLPDEEKNELKGKADELLGSVQDKLAKTTTPDEVYKIGDTVASELEAIRDGAIESAKEGVLTELEELAQSLKDEIDGSDLSDEAKTELKDKADEILENVKTEIKEKTTFEEVYELGETAESEIAFVQEEAIATAREEAVAALETYAENAKNGIASSDLSPEEQADHSGQIDAEVEATKEEITAAADFEAIANALAEAMAEIDRIQAIGHIAGPAATCTAPQVCTVCGKELAPALGHDLQHHEAQAATCTEIGWNAYDTCSRCDYTTYEEIPALGHTEGAPVRENEAAATCTAAGSYDEVVYCSVCGEELSREEKTIEALGHTEGAPVRENEAAATCTAAGSYDEVVYCSVCGEELSRAGMTIEALGHDIVKHEGQAATCTQNGWNDYETCSRCDYTTYREIAATGHTPGTAATCTSAQRCTVCGTTLVPARGHHFVDGYCSVCGAIDGTALDNDKDDAKTDLDDIAQDAKDEIDGSDLPDDVKEDLKDKVDEIINGAKDEVEGSTDFDDIDQAVENTKDEIEDAILDAEKDDAKSDLDEIAQGAKDEVDGSDLPDDVKDDLKDKIDEIVNDAKTEIDGETSKEEVDQTVEDAQQEIEDAILNAEKDDAKSDLDKIAQSAKDEIGSSGISDEEKAELKDKVDAAIEDAKEAIDNATSKEEVENIVNDTREDIDDLLKGSLDNELAEKKDAAISDLTEIAQDAKDGIDGSDISDEEKDELKGKVDEIVNDAKDEIEGAVTPEEIDEILAEAENEIAAVTEDLKAGQLNTSTLWPWIIVAIVISAALSTLFAWRHVKKVQGKGEAVGAKSVVTIAVATILIFVVVIGITLLIFAMV